jgi:hypothetical protein
MVWKRLLLSPVQGRLLQGLLVVIKAYGWLFNLLPGKHVLYPFYKESPMSCKTCWGNNTGKPKKNGNDSAPLYAGRFLYRCENAIK